MAHHRPGSVIEAPELPGRWQVWSAADDAPGALFVVPVNDEARAAGIKFAAVRVIQEKAKPFPTISLIRTDPHKPELFTTPTRKARR